MIENYETANRSLSLEEVTPPAVEPISLSELKNALRIDDTVTNDDALLTMSIKTARRILEKAYHLRMVNQTWRLFMDAWPAKSVIDPVRSKNYSSPYALSEVRVERSFLDLVLKNVTSVTHLKSYDLDGNTETFDSSNYFLDTSHKPSRLVLKSPDASWPPVVLRPAKGIEVEYVVGFGALATSVPDEMRMAVLCFAQSIYDSRGCDMKIPEGVFSLMSSWRSIRL